MRPFTAPILALTLSLVPGAVAAGPALDWTRLPAGPAPAAALALLPEGALAPGGVVRGHGLTAECELWCGLPSPHPCAADAPVSVRVRVRAFQDARVFELAAGDLLEQALADKRAEFERLLHAIQQNASALLRVGPLRTEPVPGGALLVFDDLLDCSDRRGRRERPEAWAFAAARGERVLFTVDVEGGATAAEAAALARALLARLAATAPAVTP